MYRVRFKKWHYFALKRIAIIITYPPVKTFKLFLINWFNISFAFSDIIIRDIIIHLYTYTIDIKLFIKPFAVHTRYRFIIFIPYSIIMLVRPPLLICIFYFVIKSVTPIPWKFIEVIIAIGVLYLVPIIKNETFSVKSKTWAIKIILCKISSTFQKVIFVQNKVRIL